jgi:hypothetical protein
MKKITLFLSLFICFGSVVFAQNKSGGKIVFGKTIDPANISPSGHVRCSSNEYEEYLRAQNPKMETRAQFETWMSQKIKDQQTMSQTGGIIYIPVVVHVLHNGDAYGASENITDEQVQSQMTVMTQDFRKMIGTPGYNTDPVGADVQVEFVLAKVDPNGNPTNGINRVNLCKASWSRDELEATGKPATIWDPTQYMNMWSVNFTDTTLLGYAQFPQTTLGGMSNATQSANTDGVVANYNTFGSRTLVPTGTYGSTAYDEGRTMTHEVGHFLGLRHIWGDDACPTPDTNVDTNEDFVADTPAAAAANYGCANTVNSCTSPGRDMVENYMDYSDDSCMNIFTIGQKARILTVLANSPRRNYAASNKDVAIPLFAIDAEVIIENACGLTTATCAAPNPTSPAKRVLLYNRGTSNLTAATLSYKINGGTTYTNNWSGNLAPNKYVSILLANTATNGSLTVTVTDANGGADQRATNNVSTKLFGTNIAYANATSFTFNLVGDSYGSETSWTLKNQAGTTLYQGGPYTDIPTGTQVLVNNATWTLPANGCYYLTMNDSWGDGLYDGVSQGYYDVKVGTTPLFNVQFRTVYTGNGNNAVPTSGVRYFTNDVNKILASDTFAVLDDIVLYPNPSKDFFKIQVPSDIQVAGKVEMYNNLGQKVITKVVSSDNDLNIDATSISNGVYFVTVTLNGASKTLRFVKE